SRSFFRSLSDARVKRETSLLVNTSVFAHRACSPIAFSKASWAFEGLSHFWACSPIACHDTLPEAARLTFKPSASIETHPFLSAHRDTFLRPRPLPRSGVFQPATLTASVKLLFPAPLGPHTRTMPVSGKVHFVFACEA